MLKQYEALDDAGRENQVNTLLNLGGQRGIPAVCRVICYDRSQVLAKLAAVRLMQSLSGEATKPQPELAAEIRKRLAACRCPPARWILSWLEAEQDPRAPTAVWSKITVQEDDLLLRRPRDTSPAIVETLLQLQIAALRRAHLGAEAADAVQRLMKLHHADPASLVKLLAWLVEQKDWAATRQVEEQFRATIAASPDLLYLLAEAQALRGDAAAADRSAAAALKLNPDSDLQALASHFRAGQLLEERGRYEWAIHEWEYVIGKAAPESGQAVVAARLLGELYHDLDRDKEAADALARALKTLPRRSRQWLLPGGTDDVLALGELRARRSYYEACHWRDAGDKVKQRAALDAALATNAYDIEVLIECYRVSDATTDYRAKIRKLIEKKVNELREQIGDEVGAAQPCNELAWLVANTEGDLEEALRYSKRSLELAGENNGSYRDTLARVYYAKGDLDEALKQQTAAVASLPHNRAIVKSLETYRAKVAERKQKGKTETNSKR